MECYDKCLRKWGCFVFLYWHLAKSSCKLVNQRPKHVCQPVSRMNIIDVFLNLLPKKPQKPKLLKVRSYVVLRSTYRLPVPSPVSCSLICTPLPLPFHSIHGERASFKSFGSLSVFAGTVLNTSIQCKSFHLLSFVSVS